MSDIIAESLLYQNVMESLHSAGELINMNQNALERLKRPRRSIIVSIPVYMDDGNITVFRGYRVQHN